MPTSPLPEHASLEHLKNQAKLVRDLIRSRDEGALSMVDEFHPRFDPTDLEAHQLTTFKLSDAQLIIARMYRCASWTKLRDHLKVVGEHSFTPAPERAGYVEGDESFVELACLSYAERGPNPHDRLERAHQMLQTDPSLATGSIAALATVGDHRQLAAALDEDPSAADTPCGPNGWPPLLYNTYSRIESDNPAWSSLETLDLLLHRGADPNSGFLWRGLVPPFTALTGAFGGGESRQQWHPDRLAMARRLLEAGADPNDGQGLYNNGIGGQNHDDPSHLRLLIEFGLGTGQNGPWYQRLGKRLREPAELLYDELEAACHRGRPNILRYLISLELDLERPVGRFGKTPVRLAAAGGHDAVLAILEEANLDVELESDERFHRHVRSDDAAAITELLSQHPDLLDSLFRDHPGAIASVTSQGAEVLSVLIDLGFDINARTGGSGTTALHGAAQGDDVALARLLIGNGADPNLPDTFVGSTPWGWANHFNQDQAAAYLQPLTDHEKQIEVVVSSTGASETVTTLAAFDSVLDTIEDGASNPLLVRLANDGAHLSIGVGHPEASVVLYLDIDGRPWHATEEPRPALEHPLTFAAEGGPFDFYPEAAIAQRTARRVARDFAIAPHTRPVQVHWRREGNDTGSR